MKKRFFIASMILALVLMSAFVFTGCNSNNGENTSEEVTNEATNTTEENATEEETTEEEVVEEEEEELVPVLANGTYNFKFSDADLRNQLMAEAEDYLLHNQYAGVPLFANARFALYSGRMQLPTEVYLPVMEYATGYASMAADDSKVIMEDGEPGEEGKFTYRTSVGQNPSSWNQWTYDDDTSSRVLGEVLDSPYRFQLNADKTGYALNPSMADGDPVAVDGRTLPSGKVVSKVWRITYKDGLEWMFNDGTDTSFITDYTIDANDFYETYKIALTEGWFRALSGGFADGDTSIVNAQAYVDGTAEWEEVGIKLIDDKTIEFTYEDEQSAWNVKYSNSSFVMSPINVEQYENLGEGFALDHNSIAYSGVYYVDYYENDKIIRFTKNDDFHMADQFFYTNRTFNIIADSEMVFQEFVAGKLDAVVLPAAHYEEYKSHPGLKRLSGTTTYRLMINGLGTVEAQAEEFPESTWTPEPIFANQNFKMGLYHAIDRKKLAEEVLKTSQTQMYLFTDAYLVEAETGIAFRDTVHGQSVGADLSPSTHGYNFDAAKAYYEKALDELVEAGVYAPGDAITFEFYFFSGSETQELLGAYLKDAFEAAFQSEKHNINVTVEPIAKDFPGIYYDHMMIGEFDTAIGGISGSTLNAAGFLDTYTSDNRSGFTLNWGIDTSIPEIEIVYVNDAGEKVAEIWSYDALIMALVGDCEVVDGVEVIAETE
jgi:ABC-type oligopeptide transport system substrate-binding subunit